MIITSIRFISYWHVCMNTVWYVWTWRDVDRWSSLRLFFAVFHRKWRNGLDKRLPPDVVTELLWVHPGWDNRDLRARFLFEHWLGLQSLWISVWKKIPDCHLVVRNNEPKELLSSLLWEWLTCFYFVWIYPDHDKEKQQSFDQLSNSLKNLCQSYLITNQYDISSYDEDDRILWDFDADVHKRFYCPVTMLYLVNRDGFVVWRSLEQYEAEMCSFIKNYRYETAL